MQHRVDGSDGWMTVGYACGRDSSDRGLELHEKLSAVVSSNTQNCKNNEKVNGRHRYIISALFAI